MQLSIRDVTFAYEGSYENVFDHLTVNLDTSWRLGLIGRNGRGKTTLLNLLLGRYACQGHIQLPLQPVYFPFPVEDSSQLSLFVMQQAAPDVEDWQLIRECNLLKVEPDVLYRPFDTLSRGEQ
ncbi:MAG: ATP-binding cassette domain-containing protein, partial [Candidatus Limiplasma sp.]|nr:ATP-binding cassette domain-containing protein [Candidatus Limiplasma sp.]